ncbi:MAG TPA: hypothetical protein VEU32_06380 [Burkholderiales bacterium]|nr:hypothetical protein [Burkholderiales bacterium]
MTTTDVSAIARNMFATQGAKAIAEAAQKADQFDKAGDREQAQMWKRVESALREMRGPRQS